MNIGSFKLEFVKEIEALEKSFLKSYKSGNKLFLEKLLKPKKQGGIFLVIESSNEKLDKYLHRLISLRDLITESTSDICWIITKDNDQVQHVQEIKVTEIPDKYLPPSNLFYEEL